MEVESRICKMETSRYLIDYYQSYDEDSRLVSRHGSVEFLTTMLYLEKYLKPDSHILEIGAGTGRYSHALARQGYTVDAVELVDHNIKVFQENTHIKAKLNMINSDKLHAALLIIFKECLLI